MLNSAEISHTVSAAGVTSPQNVHHSDIQATALFSQSLSLFFFFFAQLAGAESAQLCASMRLEQSERDPKWRTAADDEEMQLFFSPVHGGRFFSNSLSKCTLHPLITKPPLPSTEHKITSWGGKNGIRYLNIHSNLSSSISTSSCRVNHELRAAARCNAVAQVSKRTAHSFTSAELKSECVFTVKEGSPSAAPVPPQTIFLCALCPVRVRCIPFPKPHSPPPQKPRRSSAGNKPRK